MPGIGARPHTNELPMHMIAQLDTRHRARVDQR